MARRSNVRQSVQRNASAVASFAAVRVKSRVPRTLTYISAAPVSRRKPLAKPVLGYGAPPHAKRAVRRILALPRPQLSSYDRRRYDPTFRLSSWPSRVVADGLSGLKFKNPRTVVCVRRGVRREVLFAFKKTRSGAGASRRRFSFNSRIGC